jgi:hypothetical protein
MNTTTPSSSSPSPSCRLALSDGDLRRFDAEGYLAYENFLSPGEVRSATAAIGELIAKAYQCGRASVLGETSTLQDDLPGRQRLYIQYEPGIDASKVAPDDCEEHVRKVPASRLDPARVVPVPLRAGGAMVFSGMLPHMTPANRSARRRRAVQLHFRHPHSQIVSRREYSKLFAEADGTPAACDSWQYLDGRGDIHRGNHR